VQPGLPALTVDAPPESLRGQMSLKSHFPPATWDILRRAVYSRASHRYVTCQTVPNYVSFAFQSLVVSDSVSSCHTMGDSSYGPNIHCSSVPAHFGHIVLHYSDATRCKLSFITLVLTLPNTRGIDSIICSSVELAELVSEAAFYFNRLQGQQIMFLHYI
jgi:hypothetical protein